MMQNFLSSFSVIKKSLHGKLPKKSKYALWQRKGSCADAKRKFNLVM